MGRQTSMQRRGRNARRHEGNTAHVSPENVSSTREEGASCVSCVYHGWGWTLGSVRVREEGLRGKGYRNFTLLRRIREKRLSVHELTLNAPANLSGPCVPERRSQFVQRVDSGTRQDGTGAEDRENDDTLKRRNTRINIRIAGTRRSDTVIPPINEINRELSALIKIK